MVLLFYSCSSNSELILSENTKVFWAMTKFNPINIMDISGEYKYSNGHGGGILELNCDSTFYLNEWSSLIFPSDPYQGFIGKYSIKSDSLFLNLTSFAVDTTKFIKLYYNGQNEDNIAKAIQDSLNVKSNNYYKSIDSLKTIGKYEWWSDRNKFYIKRIGESIFMVRFSQKHFFTNELKRNYNFPTMCSFCKEKIFGFHFTKIK